MADPRPCYACNARAAGLRDLRPEGAVELACMKHRDLKLVPKRAFRCEACTVVAPLTLLETRRGPRWLCFGCSEAPELGAGVLTLSTKSTPKETPDA